MNEQGSGRVLGGLSGLRLLAALTVVYVHSANAFVAVPALRAVGSVAYPVVDLFFLLSGFVIAWTWRPGQPARVFWRRRAARIVPTHVLTWLIAVPVLWAELDVLHVWPSLAALLLLTAWIPDPTWYHAGNGVAWSLTGELVFYASVPLLRPRLEALSLRRLLGTAVCCLVVVETCAVATLLWVAPAHQIGVLYINPLLRAVECWAGACLAVAVGRGWRLPVPLRVSAPLLLGLFGTLAVLTMRLDNDLPRAAVAFAGQVLPDGVPRPLGIAITLPLWPLLLSRLAGDELDGRPVRWLAASPLVRASTWTYALYMTHGSFVKLVEAGVKNVPLLRTAVGGVVVEVVFLAASVGLARLVYQHWERPWERRLRGSSTRPAVPDQRVAAVADAVSGTRVHHQPA